jgi:hypothetical protein
LAQPSDESKSKILLDPELNPIMNPLLAAHMGRWAEVYFTTPPEKREQAVAELVRELARDAATSKADSAIPEINSAGSRSPRAEWEISASGKSNLPRGIATPGSDQEWFASKLQAPILQRAAIEKADAERAAAETAEAARAGIEPEGALREGEQPGREPLGEPKSGLPTRDPEPHWNFRGENNFSPPQPANPADFAGGDSQVTVCQSCGHLNLGGQRFCGMCGSTLPSSPADRAFEPPPELLPEPPPQSPSARWDETQESTEESAVEGPEPQAEFGAPTYAEPDPLENAGPSRHYSEYLAPEQQQVQEHTRAHGEEHAQEQEHVEVQEDVREEDEYLAQPDRRAVFSSYAVEPPRPSYRLYLGLVVVIILGVLVYVTWRDNSGKSAVPAALPSAVPDSSPPESSARTTSAASPKPNVPATSHPSALRQDAVEQGGLPQSAATPKVSTGQTNLLPANEGPKAPANSRPLAASGAGLPSPASEKAGADELAAAQRFLQAGPEGASQAVPLLWKAVAKQNAAAALLLSDLYLRGEGVGKSCDQAKLLLRAAAKKAGSAAADRLQRLKDSGCQ